MKKFNIALTEEQIEAILAVIVVEGSWGYGIPTAPEHRTIYEALQQAEPIQEKVWLPFATLKDGGTYLTRNGRKVIVVKHPTVDVELLHYPYRDNDNLHICWTKAGRHYWEDDDSPNDLILELQPSEE